MKLQLLPLGITLAVVGATVPAVADEVWQSEYGSIVYQEDRGSTAIWSYSDFPGGAMFIDGLAGVYSDRGSYSGYWVQNESAVRCDTYREGLDGEPSYYWGNLQVIFLDPGFPARWTADWSYCDRGFSGTWDGTPITGQ